MKTAEEMKRFSRRDAEVKVMASDSSDGDALTIRKMGATVFLLGAFVISMATLINVLV